MNANDMVRERRMRPRRSVLYVPANNARALAKIGSLDADCTIVDLEDSVAPDDKDAARLAFADHFSGGRPEGRESVIRINALDTPWGRDDLAAAVSCHPDAVLLPKVSAPGDIVEIEEMMSSFQAPETIRLWAMIETPAGIARCRQIAETASGPPSRLECLVAGTNDLAKEAGTALLPGRAYLVSWLMEIVLCARMAGIDAIDGVSNEFRDEDRLREECRQGRQMGFDGKTLIHPAQIAPANKEFGVSPEEIETARRIVDAFATPEHAGKGVISLDGKMVERLHLQQAEKLLAKASASKD